MQRLSQIKREYALRHKPALSSFNINVDEQFEYLKNIASCIQPNFYLTNETNKILYLLLLYFTGQGSFESHYNNIFRTKASLNKGILLIGGVGVGKTLMFEIFKAYTTKVLNSNKFYTYSSSNIIDSCWIRL